MFFGLAEVLNQPKKLDRQIENRKRDWVRKSQITNLAKVRILRLCGLAELICGQPTVGDKYALFTTLP